MSDLIIKPYDQPIKEEFSLKSRPAVKPTNYKAETVELSDNIKKFDRKVHTKNPFDFNTISMAKKVDRPSTTTSQTASDMLTNPTYNYVGKFLGVDTLHDWGRYYDKVYLVTEWAKKKVGDDRAKITQWITQQSRRVPAMGAKRIDDLYIAAKLEMERRK